MSSGVRRHAVIGDEDDRHAVVQSKLRDARDEVTERRVEMHGRLEQLGGPWPVDVADVIHFLKIERDERRTFRIREREPVEHAIHALLVPHAAVERPPTVRPHAVDGRFASRPEHVVGVKSLLDRRHPDRLAAPPLCISHLRRRHRKFHAPQRIPHRVLDDAVVSRVETGHDGVMIGKGERRKRRNQFLRANATRGECLHVRHERPIDVVPTPSVE
jgi:hypothetical protein